MADIEPATVRLGAAPLMWTMAMTADDILVHPALEPSVRTQAQSLLQMQEASPRISSLFATQQRWLMAHAALAQYFRNEASAAGTGLLAERFVEVVERHELASRNTAAAFLKEMLRGCGCIARRAFPAPSSIWRDTTCIHSGRAGCPRARSCVGEEPCGQAHPAPSPPSFAN